MLFSLLLGVHLLEKALTSWFEKPEDYTTVICIGKALLFAEYIEREAQLLRGRYQVGVGEEACAMVGGLC